MWSSSSCNAGTKPRLRAWAWVLSAWMAAGIADASWREVVNPAQRAGGGDFRWFGFRIYTAELWTSRLPFDASQPYALRLTYHRAISRDQFVDTSLDEIKRTRSEPPDPERLKRWRSLMQSAFVDVAPNDQITGLHLPGRGVRFYYQDRQTADINDAEFAQAFFAIWLSPASRDQDLRNSLLGKAAP
ncbi:chalcone isomerase family protein [Parachitinimonas caeni]|uniref:Chalcone isomerase family protein n=1 Tax=Parachitinimonas caeni TaxID=3031301 RepID=A0ABT7DXD6_9NEIS|nr:chalcone isomerase family protein [Parachitinimonas caeni]MDK2124731.1 chalcone isomerase family protein [Parachitinimonas caeni]